jgi:hypothetical protein
LHLKYGAEGSGGENRQEGKQTLKAEQTESGKLRVSGLPNLVSVVGVRKPKEAGLRCTPKGSSRRRSLPNSASEKGRKLKRGFIETANRGCDEAAVKNLRIRGVIQKDREGARNQ